MGGRSGDEHFYNVIARDDLGKGEHPIDQISALFKEGIAAAEMHDADQEEEKLEEEERELVGGRGSTALEIGGDHLLGGDVEEFEKFGELEEEHRQLAKDRFVAGIKNVIARDDLGKKGNAADHIMALFKGSILSCAKLE